jgi:uncharacterized protein (TIGR00266 family)
MKLRQAGRKAMQYQITGGSLPVALCTLAAGEAVYSEAGGMAWMDDSFAVAANMEGGLLGGLTRKLSGESLYLTTYTARARGQIAFAAELPGAIKAIRLAAGETLICQKDAFLAAERSVRLSVYFRGKIGAGLFGGEGFIMRKLTGPGVLFAKIDGSAVEYGLAVGQKMLLGSGCLAVCDETVDLGVQMVKGFKNMLFGGAGLFLTTVAGPGRVWLRSLPFSRLAGKALTSGDGK